jgi:glucosylceramidase
MDGFGFSLTGGSAMLFNTKLDTNKRKDLLTELFGNQGIGVSYLRISIGASDLDELVFSYNDIPKGEVDPELKNFSLSYDTLHLIPVLKEILTINPNIKIMGSPWSAPVWMKDNGKAKGGKLLPKFYAAYANYFVKYLQQMEKVGIPIDAITIQNEPENPNNTPSMVMTAEEQTDFIKNHLGPAFEKHHLATKIILFDHNADHPEYPITVLNDTVANKFIDGSAFHLYLGEVNALSKVHDAHPDKNIYFTEQWTSGNGEFGGDLRWHVKNLIIGASRNWSKTVLEWNLAADPKFNPHTEDGGCTLCLGALTIGEEVTRNVSYYIIAHASKFVPPGSVRVSSTLMEGLPNVAFLTPDGKVVVIILNDGDQAQQATIQLNQQKAEVTLPAGAVATVVW